MKNNIYIYRYINIERVKKTKERKEKSIYIYMIELKS